MSIHRYNKTHKGEIVCKALTEPHIEDIGLTPFAQAMPEQYKHDNPITAYRNYYNGEKQHLFSWKNRDVPEWIKIITKGD